MTKTSFAVPDSELDALLARYTRDITAQDRTGKFDPITGRDIEIDQMILVLLQRMRKNVVLLGEAGTGKTALFVGLAQWINGGKVPAMLKGARLIELEMSMIGAGSQSRADLEGRLIPILKGVAERNAVREAGDKVRPPIIFCIDEVHQLMLAFKASSYSGIADLMKPYLTAGDLYVVAATTREEYDDYVSVEPAIDRRFQKIALRPADLAMTLDILMNVKTNFEKHYGIEITRDATARLIKLTDKFIRNRNNPDKSILVLDQACARYVKEGGKGALDEKSIHAAVAAEAGIDAAAIS
ncbi:MAG: AAA family ATPase [Alphaproteobacteria bacterium]|nr:AAA family ATPase [Alphaproteobacteria bacterium]